MNRIMFLFFSMNIYVNDMNLICFFLCVMRTWIELKKIMSIYVTLLHKHRNTHTHMATKINMRKGVRFIGSKDVIIMLMHYLHVYCMQQQLMLSPHKKNALNVFCCIIKLKIMFKVCFYLSVSLLFFHYHNIIKLCLNWSTVIHYFYVF